MNAKYKDGRIEFDLHNLLQSVTPETKAELIESLACDDQIIKHVADQIIHGWTENVCSGGSSIVATAEPYDGLDWAWREVAKRSGQVAQREIERLEKAVAYHQEQYRDQLLENARLREQLSIHRNR